MTEFQHDGHRAFMFPCPGCECSHFVPIEGPRAWGWNGSLTAPTFTPSILVRSHTHVPPVNAENMAEYERAPWPQAKVETVCHSFIKDGTWQFLGDCTHALAGKTVPMEEDE